MVNTKEFKQHKIQLKIWFVSAWKLKYRDIWYLVNSKELEDIEVQATNPHAQSPSGSLSLNPKPFPGWKDASYSERSQSHLNFKFCMETLCWNFLTQKK